MANLKFGGDMQRIKVVFLGIVFWILTVSTGWAITITEPKAGTVFHPGDKVMVKANLASEEDPRQGVIIFTGQLTDDDCPIFFSGPYECGFTIKKHFLGEGKITFVAKLPNGDIKEAKVTITVVLPPTTTVTGIGADFTGRKETFLQIARKPSGDFVPSGAANENNFSVGADYSDGVARDITNNPNVTYKSLNEKVAIVIPPGQWEIGPGQVVTDRALVKATGPGKTSIIVQYGEFTDRVTVNVKECPYTEGMKRCPR